MSRIDILEQRVADLERNVGSAMGELELVTVSTRKGSDNYREGLNKRIKMIYSGVCKDEKQLVYSVGKRVAFRYYGKPIYYPSERAIFDLHIPAGTHYVFHGAICVSTGIIRSLDERDIREILFEEHSDFFSKDLIQDMEHPTDLYVVDKVL